MGKAATKREWMKECIERGHRYRAAPDYGLIETRTTQFADGFSTITSVYKVPVSRRARRRARMSFDYLTEFSGIKFSTFHINGKEIT